MSAEPICPWCKGHKRHAGLHIGFRYCPVPGCVVPGGHDGPCQTRAG